MSQTQHPAFASIAPLPIAQRVTEALREAILSGTLVPGQQLLETELAEQMGVSRAPIREAFQRLEEEQLVERIPYRGAFVTNFTERDLRELNSLRSMVEQFAVQLIIQRQPPADLSPLEQNIQTMSRAAEQEDLSALSAIDIAFHRTIVQLADHSRLLQVWDSHEANMRRMLTFRNRLKSDMLVIVENHRTILQAIAKHDLAAARDLLREHIEISGERLIRD